MIPRRRIDIRWRDVYECFRSLWTSAERDKADVICFETKFAQLINARYCRATSSGRAALGIILDALELQVGDEVLIPAYTLKELLPVITTRQLRPIPVDIDLSTYNMDANLIAAHISSNTKAILVAHMFGVPANLNDIIDIARQHSLVVIEDCAHSLGSYYFGRSTGTYGDYAFFSFESTKPLNTYGGGMIVSNAAARHGNISKLLDHSSARTTTVVRKLLMTLLSELLTRSPLYRFIAQLLFSGRFSSRFESYYRRTADAQRPTFLQFTALQARIGISRIGSTCARNAVLNRHRRYIEQRLPGYLTAQARSENDSESFYLFVVQSKIDPLDLRPILLKAGIDVAIGSEIEDDCSELLNRFDCPRSASLYRSTIAIPVLSNFSAASCEYISKTLLDLERSIAKKEIVR